MPFTSKVRLFEVQAKYSIFDLNLRFVWLAVSLMKNALQLWPRREELSSTQQSNEDRDQDAINLGASSRTA